jgi:hypothetical protein
VKVIDAAFAILNKLFRPYLFDHDRSLQQKYGLNFLTMTVFVAAFYLKGDCFPAQAKAAKKSEGCRAFHDQLL